MPRFIDADDLKAVIKANDWSNPVVPDVVCLIINRSPDADVVPKSEYERLAKEFESLETLYKQEKAQVKQLNKELDKLAEEYSDLIVEKDQLFDIAEKQKVEIEAFNIANQKAYAANKKQEEEIESLTINMNAYGLAVKRLAEERAEFAKEIFAKIDEALQYEIDLEDKYGRNAWAQGDVSGFQTHEYAEDKLDTLKIALSLFKKKYTEGESNV